MKKLFSIALLLALVISGIQCSVYETLTNLSRLQFKVGAVNGFQINGIPVSGKSKLSDFNALDLLKLSTGFAQGTLPASFTLNVDAKNPNDGTGGYKKSDATFKILSGDYFLMIKKQFPVSLHNH